MVRIFCRLWYNCGQTKNHRRIGGDFSRNGGPNRDRTDDLTDANRTLSQLSYRPILPLFAGFCNKKLIFKFSDFRRIQRKTSPKSWTEIRRSMCDHRDANRTLSQLSYKPEYEVVWLRYVRLALPAELQARNVPYYYTHLAAKCKRFFAASYFYKFIFANDQYKCFVFYLYKMCAILRMLCSGMRLLRGLKL